MTVQIFPSELAAARLNAVRKRPYLASILMAFVPREVDSARLGMPGPIGVDKYFRVYYDPARLAEWTVEELAGVLYHEAQHLLRDHPERAASVGVAWEPTPVEGTDVAVDEGLVWNIACDIALNDDIVKEDGVKLPASALLPRHVGEIEGDFEEAYYFRLRQKAKATAKKASGAGGRCGSAGSGQRQSWEDGEPSGPGHGVRRAEAEIIRQQVAREVVEHVKSRGTVPSSLLRWAEERLTSKVDWRRVLAATIRGMVGEAAGRVDYSYSRPSRRQAAVKGIVLPTMRRPDPKVGVVVDTSGSMSEKELAIALAEVEGVLRAVGTGVSVASCDASVGPVKKVFRRADVRLTGGGGTDMRVGIEAVSQTKPQPSVVVVVTDGETPWPSEPNGVPLVVVLTQAKPRYSTPPPWARVVVVG